MSPFWTKFARHVRNFGKAERGNVVVTFAISLLPVVGTVGFAVDYSNANAAKVALQTALDSTALMLAKNASTMSSSAIQTNATNYFKAMFNRPDATNVTVTATYSTSGGSNVVVNGSARVPTTFLGVIGYDYLTVNGSSTTKWSSTRLRVALALDNTGSMSSDGKMTALKSATKSLLTQLQNSAAANGDVYVSIIPFSKDVNIGASNYAANYIDWSDWDDDNGSWQTTTSCTSSGSSRRGKTRCTSTQSWVPYSHSTWNGCITDRDQNYDQLVTAPNPSDVNLSGNTASTLFPAEQYSNCPLAMMGLSYNWAAMNSLVDQMYPAGNTNQPIGLVWAWQSLVGGGPLTAPPKDSSYQYTDIIILMSDGLNTQNRWSSSQTPIDNRMYQTGNGSGTCANIKAAGVIIYTIHVNTDGDPTSTLLKNCASSTDKFFTVTTASGISDVFTTIGNGLTKLRVAQ